MQAFRKFADLNFSNNSYVSACELNEWCRKITHALSCKKCPTGVYSTSSNWNVAQSRLMYTIGVRPVDEPLFSISDYVRLRLLVIKCHCYKFVNAIFFIGRPGTGTSRAKIAWPWSWTWAVAVNLRMKSAFLLCQGRYGSARGPRLRQRPRPGGRGDGAAAATPRSFPASIYIARAGQGMRLDSALTFKLPFVQISFGVFCASRLQTSKRFCVHLTFLSR